jgi:hypothetical protein
MLQSLKGDEQEPDNTDLNYLKVAKEIKLKAAFPCSTYCNGDICLQYTYPE